MKNIVTMSDCDLYVRIISCSMFQTTASTSKMSSINYPRLEITGFSYLLWISVLFVRFSILYMPFPGFIYYYDMRSGYIAGCNISI